VSVKTRSKVVKLKPPGPPAPCRQMPEPTDAIETVTRYHHWQDERDKRRAVHQNLDEALLGVVPPGMDAAIRPSTLLYGGRLEAVVQQWDQRWWTARLLELGHFPIAEFLATLGRGLSCRRGQWDVAGVLARYLGWRVHTVIQGRYQKAREANRVSLDNRVYTVGGSEQLSRLALLEPRGEYGTLNFALAGTRADIIDFTTREMFEIKPAGLASEAVLQLWAYLDNHEVARTFNALVDDGATVPPLEVGDASALPESVTEPFTIQVRGIKTPLAIQPYTVNRLPGLILYTVGIDVSEGRQAAAAAIALGRNNMNDLMIAAGRTELQRREAAVAAARMGQYISTGVLIVCLIILTRGAALAAGGAAGGAAASGGTALGAGEAGGAVGGQVLRFTARKVLEETTREAVKEASTRAAAAIIITTASGQFTVPPEAAGPVLDANTRAGTQLSAPSTPSL
jgi:hypothetical protein